MRDALLRGHAPGRAARTRALRYRPARADVRRLLAAGEALRLPPAAELAPLRAALKAAEG